MKAGTPEAGTPEAAGGPSRDCPLCPRLASFRGVSREAHPDWFNAPVPSFGPIDARLLVVGLAPGLRGANRTGRPFTGDHAGMLLYETLIGAEFARGSYGAEATDGLVLLDCRISNAVRCVPPANRPLPAEVAACNAYLAAELGAMERLRLILALGVLAHDAVLRALGLKPGPRKFRHGQVHELPGGVRLADSYHVSRYNTSTRRLTAEMFGAVIDAVRAGLDDGTGFDAPRLAT